MCCDCCMQASIIPYFWSAGSPGQPVPEPASDWHCEPISVFSVYLWHKLTYLLPLFPPQTDILCGFLIVIVSLYSIVFYFILSCILPHNCYRLVSACCCKPLLSDIIIIIIIITYWHTSVPVSTSDLLPTSSSSTNIAARRFLKMLRLRRLEQSSHILYTLLTVSLVLGLRSRLTCSQDICSRSTVRASDNLTGSFARYKFVTYTYLLALLCVCRCTMTPTRPYRSRPTFPASVYALGLPPDLGCYVILFRGSADIATLSSIISWPSAGPPTTSSHTEQTASAARSVSLAISLKLAADTTVCDFATICLRFSVLVA